MNARLFLLFSAVLIFSASPIFSQDLLIPYRKGDKWGFCDVRKNILIEPIYYRVKPFQYGYAVVESEKNSGSKIIDKQGKVSFEASSVNLYIELFDKDVAIGRDKHDDFVIDLKTGKYAVEPGKYKYIRSFSEGFAVFIDLQGKTGLIDVSGREIFKVTTEKTYISSVREGICAIQGKDKKWGFIRVPGLGAVCDFKYSGGGLFSEGMAAVEKKTYVTSKWGFIDKSGKEVITPQFDAVSSFSEGLAAVRIDSSIGFIDKTGKMVIPLTRAYSEETSKRGCKEIIFDEGEPRFTEGVARIGSVYIDRSGTILLSIPKEYAALSECMAGLISYNNDGTGYVINKQLKSVFSLKGFFFFMFTDAKFAAAGIIEIKRRDNSRDEGCYYNFKENVEYCED
jgi:hypothetical protein